MATKSAIEWTEATWNPTVGCTKISQGCKHCYAEVMHRRLNRMGPEKYKHKFTQVRPWFPHLKLPLHWRQPRLIFVNSMSDLFHEEIGIDYIQKVFRIMTRARQHTFQVLTKRASRLAREWEKLDWAPNIWIGVSVEDSAALHRVDALRTVAAASIRFLSLEPLLAPLDRLQLNGIHWVIVGGESGAGARPMDLAWVQQIRNQCLNEGVKFFLKQLGGARGKRGGKKALLDGRRWTEMPVWVNDSSAMAV